MTTTTKRRSDRLCSRCPNKPQGNQALCRDCKRLDMQERRRQSSQRESVRGSHVTISTIVRSRLDKKRKRQATKSQGQHPQEVPHGTTPLGTEDTHAH